MVSTREEAVNRSQKNANSTKQSNGSKDAILDVAEELFGQHGPDGVSLRQISATAGSANHSAVQYHFNNKEGLIRGIFLRRLNSLEKRRGMLLEDVLRQGKEKDTRALLEIILYPIAEEKNSAGNCTYAAFLLGLRVFSDLSLWALYSDSAPISRNADVLLRASLNSLPSDVFDIRYLSAISVFLLAVVRWDRLVSSNSTPSSQTREAYLKHTFDFIDAGLMAGCFDH